MPIVTLSFKLPEEEKEYEIINQSYRLQSFLIEFDQKLRSWEKYNNNFNSVADAIHEIREEFYSLLNDHRINLDL